MEYCRDGCGQWDLVKLPPENIMNLFGLVTARRLRIQSRLIGVLLLTPWFNALSTESSAGCSRNKSDTPVQPSRSFPDIYAT